jgi:hypothetical protein
MERPKSREETPKEGYDSSRYRIPYDAKSPALRPGFLSVRSHWSGPRVATPWLDVWLAAFRVGQRRT